MKTVEYKDSEIGRIPADWEVKKFKDVFDFLPTNTYAREFMTEAKDLVHNVHYGDVLIRYGSVLDFNSTFVPFLNSSCTHYQQKALVHDGDVIIADTAEDETAGKAVEILGANGRLIVSGLHTMLCRPKYAFYPGYLGYFINGSSYHNQLLPLLVGTKVSSISKSAILDTFILIPPIGQQEQIVKTLSGVDELLSKLDNAIEKKQLIKEGLMQELLTGKKRLKGFSGEWATHNFDYFIERFATGLNPRSNFKLNDGGYNYYVTIKDFIDGRLYFDGCDRIDDEALKRINERSDLKVGDILFSSIGRIGDAYVITKKPSNWNINESVFSLRPKKTIIDSQFLYYLIKSREVQDKFVENTTGSTLKSVKMGHLKLIECYFPNDIKEQKAIAETLKSIDSEIIALQSQRDKYLLIKQGMMQELLTGKTRLI